MVKISKIQTIKTLIVDDELPARQRIKDLLINRDEFEVTGMCLSGKHAIEAIQDQKPDLVFLDIQLQDMSGFEVLEKSNPKHLPIVVFVTAFDEYALKAFDFHALDYLLKPFSDERFEEALSKACEQLKKNQIEDLNEKILQMIASVKKNSNHNNEEPKNNSLKYQSRLAIKSSRKITFVKTKNIDWIASEGPYVSINASGKSHLLRTSLKNMEEILDPNDFMRIHRSTIININRIKELHSHFHGEFFIILENGKKFKLSRKYRANAEKLLEGGF